jgi:hypothetical protein
MVGCLMMGMVAGAQEPESATKAATQEPRNPAETILTQQAQPDKDKKKEKKEEKKGDKTAPPEIDFSAAFASQAESPTGLNPHMIGDLGLASLVTVKLPTIAKIQIPINNLAGVPPQMQTIFVPTNVHRTVRVPFFGRGGFNISENEGVLPQTRAFFTYNYYDNATAPAQGSDVPHTVTQNFTFQGQTFVAQVLVPGFAPPRLDVNRETVGFEKAFFDGAFSLGMRVPIFQQNGAEAFHDAEAGDLTIIAKFAPYIDRETGSGISLGMAVTAPTGPAIHTVDADVHSTVLQPFIGYQFNRENFLLYGFASIGVPTDTRDVTILFNDIGLGYRLWEGDGLIRSLVPAVEAHITTPLDHRQSTDLIQGLDEVVLTGGVHMGLGRRSLLTLGVATPVNSPRTFNVEGIVQFNFRF